MRGRPPKSDDEKASVKRFFRVTESEDSIIKNNAAEAEVGVSKYCRRMALGKPVFLIVDTMELLKIRRQLIRNGNNLNQTVRALNALLLKNTRHPERDEKAREIIEAYELERAQFIASDKLIADLIEKIEGR